MLNEPTLVILLLVKATLIILLNCILNLINRSVMHVPHRKEKVSRTNTILHAYLCMLGSLLDLDMVESQIAYRQLFPGQQKAYNGSPPHIQVF